MFLGAYTTVCEFFHVHCYEPILSRYVSITTREILYECRCGKRELRCVYRGDSEKFPIPTDIVTSEEMQKALSEGLLTAED